MKHYVLRLVDTDEQAQEIIRGLTRAGVLREDIFQKYRECEAQA
jgi:hypothetical protein